MQYTQMPIYILFIIMQALNLKQSGICVKIIYLFSKRFNYCQFMAKLTIMYVDHIQVRKSSLNAF